MEIAFTSAAAAAAGFSTEIGLAAVTFDSWLSDGKLGATWTGPARSRRGMTMTLERALFSGKLLRGILTGDSIFMTRVTKNDSKGVVHKPRGFILGFS